MAYTVRTCYYGEPPIDDEYDEREEAQDAYLDACWAACHAPRSEYGDVQSVTLKQGETVLRRSSW